MTKIKLNLGEVMLPTNDLGEALVSDIKKAIDEHFGEATYAKEAYNKKHDSLLLEPVEHEMMEAWVHSEQKFLTIDVLHLKADELYMITGKCYRGRDRITSEEYNEYASKYNNPPAIPEEIEEMVDEAIGTYEEALEPVTKIEAGWVHSEQEFKSVDLNDIDENELYIFNGGYYHGSKKIPMSEYIELSKDKKHPIKNHGNLTC